MANKELTAKVKLDSSDAESKLKRLDALIKSINKAVTGHNNTGQLEAKLSKELITAEKVKQATLKTKQEQEKLTQEIGKSFIAEERVNQAVAKTAIEQERAKQAASKTAQEISKEFVAEERVNQAISRSAIEQERVKQATSKTAQEINKEAVTKEKVNQEILKTENLTKKIQSETSKSANNANKMGNAFKSTNHHANSLLTTVKRLASTYLGVMGAKAVIGTSDTITSAENRLNALNGNNSELTQTSMDKIYAASQRSRSGYNAMLKNVSKSMTLAGDAFQGNIDNAIKFQEIMAKSYTIGGAEPGEASSSMYQLVQALGSGVLQGDELRSVREGAPIAYKKIEEFCQGVLNTEESLKDLASQGVITSDMVVAAIMDAENEINATFDKTKITFGQAWDQIKNTAIKAFEPVLQKLNQLLNSDFGKSAIDGICKGIVLIARAVEWVFDILNTFLNWCADNWEWLKYIIIGALTVIIALLAQMAWQAIVTAVKSVISFITMHWQLLLIVAAIMAILYVYELWRQGTISLTEAIALCLMIIAVALLIVGAVIGSIPLLITAAVLAILAVIVAFFAYICGGVMWLGAQIANAGIWIANQVIGLMNWLIEKFGIFGVTLINYVIGWVNQILALAQHLVNPILSIVEFILNVCMGGFDSFGGAVANLIGQIISWFLSLGKVVTTIIDAIFGTDWTGGLNALSDKVLSWGKNENSITLDRSGLQIERINPKDVLNKDGVAFESIDYIDANAAFDTGYNWGNGINEWASQFQNQDSSDSGLFSDLSKLLGIDLGSLTGGLPDPSNPANGVGGSYDPTGANDDIADALKKLGGIEDDTGSIADSMELTQEDLEYLRRIADMEWKKEFTTANITVDMSNYNTINGENDLDGIVEKLADKLYDEMNAVANGVYV